MQSQKKDDCCDVGIIAIEANIRDFILHNVKYDVLYGTTETRVRRSGQPGRKVSRFRFR